MVKRLLVGIFIVLLGLVRQNTLVKSFAYDDEKIEGIEYVYQLGSYDITYYLDENGYPYQINEGERIPVAVPLENMRVTDSGILAYLNQGLSDRRNVTTYSWTPAEYYDLANGNYVRDYILTENYKYTDILKVRPTDNQIAIQTSDYSPFYAGHLISYVLYFYSEGENAWYNYVVNDVACSIWRPLNIISGQLYPYAYYAVKKSSSNLSGVTVSVKSTYSSNPLSMISIE